MKPILNYRPLVFVLACAALFVAGCGGVSGVKVEGRIVRGGKPYAAEGKMLSLSFASKDEKDAEAVYPAKVNADGSFVVEGPRGKGIPPGTYKVRLKSATKDNDKASLARIKEDNRQFALINNKEYEVTSEPDQKITIDLEKWKIGK